MKSIAQLEVELEELKEEFEGFELDPNDYTESFNDYLNYVYEGVFGLEPADILREMDRSYYEQMFDEYMDGVDNEEDGHYLRLVEQIALLEEEIEELNIAVCV